MATIIDALVATLELDTTDYKRSWNDVDAIDAEGAAKRDRVNKRKDKEERERARVEKQNAQQRKRDTDELTGSVVTLGKSLAAAVLGYESVIGFAKDLAKLTGGEAALGRSATKLGIGAPALNIYGKAVEYAGGKPEDALATFAKLTTEKSNKDRLGEIGPLLQLLQQKGVAYEDKSGNLLDQGKILDDLSKKTQNMKNQDRAAMFSQAGIADGVINRMLEESKLQDEQLAKAREFNRITEKGVKDSEDLVEQWHQMTDAADKAATKIRDALVPTAKHSMDAITKLASGDVMGANQSAGGAILDVGKLYERYTEKVYKGIASLGEQAVDYLFGGSASGGSSAHGTIDRSGGDRLVTPKAGSVAARNNNPGNIKAVGDQARDAQGFRIFATLAEGQAAMRGTIERKIDKGYDTIAKLITAYEGTDAQKDPHATAAYIDRVSKLTGKGMSDKLNAADIAAVINAMTIVESALPNSAMRGPPSGATPGIGGNTNNTSTASTNNSTSVSAPINIYPAAGADPSAIANQTVSALSRKIAVAQANAGQG
jgi:hypothetical protein